MKRSRWFHIFDCCINSKKTVQEPSLTMKILIWKQSRSQLTFQDRQRMNYLRIFKNIHWPKLIINFQQNENDFGKLNILAAKSVGCDTVVQFSIICHSSHCNYPQFGSTSLWWITKSSLKSGNWKDWAVRIWENVSQHSVSNNLSFSTTALQMCNLRTKGGLKVKLKIFIILQPYTCDKQTGVRWASLSITEHYAANTRSWGKYLDTGPGQPQVSLTHHPLSLE